LRKGVTLFCRFETPAGCWHIILRCSFATGTFQTKAELRVRLAVVRPGLDGFQKDRWSAAEQPAQE
jgi:hypothetical protein